MSLTKLLLRADLPNELMNVKCLTVPLKGFKRKKIHLDLYDCDAFSGMSGEEDDYYDALLNDLNEDINNNLKGSFKAISFNEFLAIESKYCDECSLEAYIFESSFDASAHAVSARFFVTSLKLMIDRVQKNVLVEPKVAWSRIFEQDGVLNIFKSFNEFEILVKDFKKCLTLDTFGVETVESREVFEKELWDYIKNDTLNSLTYKNSSPMVNLIESLKDVFVTHAKTDNSFVILDALSIRRKVVTKFLETEKTSVLASKIIFREGFNIEPFTVLPYFEFEVLKIMFKESNGLDIMAYEDFINKVAFSEFKPDPVVLETMKSLYDENNSSMTNYQNLFEIAVNV